MACGPVLGIRRELELNDKVLKTSDVLFQNGQVRFFGFVPYPNFVPNLRPFLCIVPNPNFVPNLRPLLNVIVELQLHGRYPQAIVKTLVAIIYASFPV